MRNDITGFKQLYYEVIRDTGEQKVLCRCVCGTEKWVDRGKLKERPGMNCGCVTRRLRSERMRKKHDENTHKMIGKRFEYVEVLERTSEKKRTEYLYRCKCHRCGKEFKTILSYLTCGDVKSCGCLRKDTEPKTLRKAFDNHRVQGVAMQMFTDKPNSNNTSGYRGVVQYLTRKGAVRFKAYIMVKGKRYSKGGFLTAKDAYVNGRLILENELLPDKPNK